MYLFICIFKEILYFILTCCQVQLSTEASAEITVTVTFMHIQAKCSRHNIMNSEQQVIFRYVAHVLTITQVS